VGKGIGARGRRRRRRRRSADDDFPFSSFFFFFLVAAVAIGEKKKERKRERKEKRGKVVWDAIIVGGGHIWIKCSDISGREGMECDCGGVRTLPVHLGGHPPLMLEVFAPLSPFSLPPSFSSLFSNFSFESSPRKMSSTDSRKKRMLK